MWKWLRWPAVWLNKHYIDGSEFEIYVSKGALKCLTGVCMGSFLDVKVVHFFETLGYVKLPTMLHNVPEDQNHQCQCCGNIKSHIDKACLYLIVIMSMIACSCYWRAVHQVLFSVQMGMSTETMCWIVSFMLQLLDCGKMCTGFMWGRMGC